MIVADLGNEEVLLVANDSGYVTLWYTKHLLQRNGNMDIWFDVQKTAWGIAVHQKKRLIAISSNTTKIFVFEMGSESIDPTRSPKGAEDPIILSANHHNLPCVAFLDDDTGRWLATTDISGSVILYDLLRGTSTMTAFNGQGWTVTFLCESNFLWVENEEFKEMIEKAREEAQKAVRRGLLSFADRRFNDDDEDDDDEEDWASDVQMTLYAGGSEDEEYQGGVSEELSYSEDEDEDDDDEEMSDEDSDIEMNFTALEEAILSHEAEDLSEGEDEIANGTNTSEGETGEDLQVTEEMQSTAYGPITRSDSLSPDPDPSGLISIPTPEQNEEDLPWEYPPPSFIIHSKEFDLKLIIPKDPPRSPHFIYEPQSVHLNSLLTLRNLIPADGITIAAQTSNYPLRMNMHAYIPALSLYVIGRQDGRVALVRMIRSRPPKVTPPSTETASEASSKPESGETGGIVHRHFMNLEHILPKQDTAIPFALVGVCVAPVQGWEQRNVNRMRQGRWLYTHGGVGGRWRIFLLYSGGDVICYTVSGGIPAHERALLF
ncbi:hypothetical protein TWF481_000491 [Arthrobotrys musiformis]|uniref:Anaphase-promoting complex subunit 4 WD40 domain-containing protein n=1 Tax=Arthrobotrys musiformis TaxID=47236 RepID=A0AAV9WMQ0_9PEZI